MFSGVLQNGLHVSVMERPVAVEECLTTTEHLQIPIMDVVRTLLLWLSAPMGRLSLTWFGKKPVEEDSN